jgi:hypothetical protein
LRLSLTCRAPAGRRVGHLPGFAHKFESRISKPETNSKSKIRNPKRENDLFRISSFDLSVCFEFRASDFEFLGKPHLPGARPPALGIAGGKMRFFVVRRIFLR